jgi:oligoendopeptidase F
MSLLPFGSLAPFRPRRFLPAALDLGDWSQVEPLFDGLEAKGCACPDPAALEQWLLDWGELSAALDEESSRRYIAMTCHTDDPGAEKAFLHFVQEIEPRTKPRQFSLSRLFLDHAQRPNLAPDRYEVLERDTRVRVELYRDANVPLETQEAELSQQYQKLMGSLTVRFRGQEWTLVQMGRLLEEPDRATRQEAWDTVARRRLEVAGPCEDLFDQLLGLRERMAANAGFANYRDYAFRALRRFDYAPADCLAFHDAIEREVMPAVRRLQVARRAQLGLDRLRPWDLAVDPLQQPPLKPFGKTDELVARSQRIFARLDPTLARWFEQLHTRGLIDLDNRKGKAPGGYQSTLAEARLPFIFMNAVGLQRDVETLLHEAGHAFHALATQTEDLYPYRSAPIEFCEVASMSMELLGSAFLEEFYGRADAARARRRHLEGIVDLFPWVASVDAFQHWIYSHPGHSRAQRRAAWESVLDRFGGHVDWTGLDQARACLWHRQLHIFLHPFYYVEYAIAQMGALQVWANARRDPAQALAQYRRALALGGARPLPELFAAAGGRFDFGAATLKPLIESVEIALGRVENPPRAD